MAINKVVLGTETLIDLTDTTATAADVAQGTYFYTAAGVRTAGTASGGGTGGITQDAQGYLVLSDQGGGGGGGSVKMGVLRPDAELVKRWTYDRYLVQDEGIAIPSYNTSAKTMVGTTDLQTVTPDYDTYDYAVLQRFLAIPTYATESTANYRQCYYFGTYVFEITEIPSQTIAWGNGTINSARVEVKVSMQYWSVYWNYNALQSSAQSYGAYFTSTTPTVASTTGGNITVKSPALMLRGGTYFPQSQWDDLTDVRYQYVLELYRTAKGAAYDGYSIKSQFIHTIECAQSASGTLT